MFSNGKTAIEGRSGRVSAGAVRGGRSRGGGRRDGRVRLQQWHPEHTHRPGDVLDRMLAEVLEILRYPVAHLLEHGARDAQAAGRGHLLEPRRDVDAIAEDVVALDHHVAEVDADPEIHAALGRHLRVAAVQLLLDLDAAADRFDGGRELGQDAVAGGADDAPVVARDQRVHRRPVRRQGMEGRLLVRGHETAVTGDIGAEDGGEPTLDVRGLHRYGPEVATTVSVAGRRPVSMRASPRASTARSRRSRRRVRSTASCRHAGP